MEKGVLSNAYGSLVVTPRVDRIIYRKFEHRSNQASSRIARTNEEEMNHLKQLLSQQFEIKGGTDVDRERYNRLVEKLIHLAHKSPNIGFSVSLVSQFMNNPPQEHRVVYRIIRYLKSDRSKGLNDYQHSRKQPVVAQGGAKAEFRLAHGDGIYELMWLQRTKHVQIDTHFISEKVEKEIITLNHAPAQQQQASLPKLSVILISMICVPS
ncbi:UNVERIFIED_CONTAM: hypothetical protein Scaly_2613800 [Sesamum calycinum]|uniref:Uncharacterized protein n=1 Tax=Sesamum calycinum TaxID=2727403 RepID=A0AAW2JC29_9LAMI